jgi:hypothetical protein
MVCGHRRRSGVRPGIAVAEVTSLFPSFPRDRRPRTPSACRRLCPGRAAVPALPKASSPWAIVTVMRLRNRLAWSSARETRIPEDVLVVGLLGAGLLVVKARAVLDEEAGSPQVVVNAKPVEPGDVGGQGRLADVKAGKRPRSISTTSGSHAPGGSPPSTRPARLPPRRCHNDATRRPWLCQMSLTGTPGRSAPPSHGGRSSVGSAWPTSPAHCACCAPSRSIR